jgi:hypothetical protein
MQTFQLKHLRYGHPCAVKDLLLHMGLVAIALSVGIWVDVASSARPAPERKDQLNVCWSFCPSQAVRRGLACLCADDKWMGPCCDVPVQTPTVVVPILEFVIKSALIAAALSRFYSAAPWREALYGWPMGFSSNGYVLAARRRAVADMYMYDDTHVRAAIVLQSRSRGMCARAKLHRLQPTRPWQSSLPWKIKIPAGSELLEETASLIFEWGASKADAITVDLASITAQRVDYSTDAAAETESGTINVLLELRVAPRTRDATIQASLDAVTAALPSPRGQAARVPDDGAALLQFAVGVEAFSTLAEALFLRRGHAHAPNGQSHQLEEMFLYLPAALYTSKRRQALSWVLHTLVPTLSLLWALWSLYANIELVRDWVHDQWRAFEGIAERFLSQHIVHALAMLEAAGQALNTLLDKATARFYAFVRPFAIVLLPASSLFRSLAGHVCTLWHVVGRVLTSLKPLANALWVALTPLWTAGTRLATALHSAMQPLRRLVSILSGMAASAKAVAQMIWSWFGGLLLTLENAAKVGSAQAEMANALFNQVKEKAKEAGVDKALKSGAKKIASVPERLIGLLSPSGVTSGAASAPPAMGSAPSEAAENENSPIRNSAVRLSYGEGGGR